MSLATTYRVEKSRKSFVCGKCGDTVLVGQPNVSFAVGFRGRSKRRCGKTECFPKPSERESSLVFSVYAAQEDFDADACQSMAELTEAVQDVISATEECQSEYENSEMFDRNEDLQERASMLEEAASTLESWADDLEEEPTEENWAEHSDAYADDTVEEAHATWLAEAREAATAAVNEMELP